MLLAENKNTAFFFGRTDVLEMLDKRLSSFLKGCRQNIGIIGPSGIGKTSLVLHFIRRIDDAELIPVYVELSEEPFDFFAQKFMGSLLASFLKSRGQQVPMEFDLLINRCRRHIPKTLNKMRQIKNNLKQEDWNDAYREILNLTAVIQQETGKKILLILDNFELLEEMLLKNPFDDFGKAVMLQKDTLYIVTSSRCLRAREILRDQLTLLFGNFEAVELEPFDFSACDAYIATELPQVRLDQNVEKFLLDLTDGHPYFFSLILKRCHYLIEGRKEKCLDESVLLDALQEELYNRHGNLHQYFSHMLKGMGKGKSFYASLRVLLAMTAGQHKPAGILRLMRGSTANEVKNTLSRLAAEELVIKKGSFFAFRLPLFGFWLRHVYQRKEFNFDYSSDLAVRSFREELKKMLRARENEEKKELQKRIEELFWKFSNEIVEFDDKKLLCPKFDKVHFKPANGRVFPVDASGAKNRWLCQVAYKPVSEEDVRVFLADIIKTGAKVHRRLMIATRGIDLNAKLLAKENKIILLGLRTLNELFELYDQPKAIF